MMERRAARRGAPHGKGAMHGEHKQQRRPGTVTSRSHQGSPPTPPGYYTAELVMALLFVAASLVFLPLVLPPLSPPPFLLLLVPVGLLAVLVALAFVPLDAQSHLAASSPL
ncbi:ARGOS-like protein [Phragmites australis]|uniref:ARGOS-like protein n=1 Tax=Phragmites australis TaxID=29695 RepID=UPI002D776FC2|nr:ARGOS-like protein [Phragmites australis]